MTYCICIQIVFVYNLAPKWRELVQDNYENSDYLLKLDIHKIMWLNFLVSHMYDFIS